MHYIDATAEQDRLGRTSGSGGGGAAGSGAGGGSGAGSKEGGPARAIHMTIKSAATDGAEVVTETIADRLRAVQVEGWRRMEYADEDTEDAWIAYQESLLIPRPEAVSAAAGGAAGEGADSGKGKELAFAGAPADELHESVDKLQTEWGEEELLRALAGIKADDPKPGEEAVRETAKNISATANKNKERQTAAPASTEAPATAAEPRKRAARSRTTGTGAAPRRGGRTTTGATSRGAGAGSGAMELD